MLRARTVPTSALWLAICVAIAEDSDTGVPARSAARDRLENATPCIIGRVVSVNVGRPRTAEWKGSTIRTGFFKYPVSGRIPFVGSSLEGDGQADREVHGGLDKALFVYSHGHYAPWASWLGRAPELGMFGENLTVDGFAEDDVAVGDVLRVGGATLVVTEPRQPCYKVDVRFGLDGAAAHMVRTGMTGFYLGLIEPGDVAAGDDVVLVTGPDADRITPGMLHRLGTTTRADDIPALRDAATNPHLPAEWQESFAAKAVRLRSREARKKAPWSGFRPFRVTRIVQESSDVRSVYLAPADGGAVPDAEAGQFVTLSFPPSEGVEPAALHRSYTISNRKDRQELRVSVRNAPDGRGGSALVHALEVGDEVGVTAPSGDFSVAAHPPTSPAVLFSAGIGITPILPMAAELAENGIPVTVVHSVRSLDDAALIVELQQLAADHAQVRLIIHVTGGNVRDSAPHLRPGRIGRDTVVHVLDDPRNTHVYICGPDDFVDRIREEALDFGVHPTAVHYERFLSPTGTRQLIQPPPDGYEVTFAVNARTVLWADAETTLLDLAEAVDADLPASCQQGVCGTCRTRVLHGEVAYVSEPQYPVDDGYCLPCVAVPAGRTTLDA